MAYSALVSLTQTTHLILNPDRYHISVRANEEIASIREHAISLISLLENFPEKANRLEGKIRDAATEAEDIIEFFMCDQISASGPPGVEIEQKLKGVREEFDSIGEAMMDYPLADSPAAAVLSSSRVTATGKNDKVVGLDKELIAIKLRLCGESSKREVIPILGMGGIGKTTLCRCAYEDRLTVETFQVRAWITISQDYSTHKILSCLRDSMKSFDEQMLVDEDEATMRDRVYNCLKGRRYLIVMDDVWSTKALDFVINMFPDDHNRSRIMLTTRLSDVATYAVSDSPVYDMKFMDEDQCWNLIKQKVFGNGNGQGCPSELEAVGEEIARSCRGLPLAVVLVAGVLCKMVETRASWEEILKNLNSIVGEQSDEILSLSYTYLPHNLRSCFLYLGGFPEDHEVRISELIKLWVAEGFLKRTNESKSLEEEAEEYLEDLVERSLVLVSSRKRNGKVKSCSLHDLVRDLCIRKAREEKFLVHAADECADVRRLSVTNYNNLRNISGSSIRTIRFQRLQESSSISLAIYGGVKLLRVLVVPNEGGEYHRIFELFHLRYVAFQIQSTIPSTISKLQNLHSLIVNTKTNKFDVKLPLEIWRMPHLRHLVVYFIYVFPDPVDGSALPVENLQTLLDVNGPVCSEKFLKMFPNVKKLGLVYDRSCSYGEYQLFNLIHLDKLEKLKIYVRDFFFSVGRRPAFPKTLKKLTLCGGGFPWKDMSIVGSLPNLEVLKLTETACDGDTWETVDGEFPKLKFLLISRSALRHWITEWSHFPELKCLILRHCQFLLEVPDGIGEIPSLEMIELDNWNSFLVDSAKEILDDQQSNGNDTLQLNIVDCLHESSSVEKTSGWKCYMIGAKELLIAWVDFSRYWEWKSCPDSRFSVVPELIGVCWLDISVKIKTQMLSSNTTYAAYLVFKLAEKCYGLESAYAVVRLVNKAAGDAEETSIVVHLQQRVDDDDDGDGDDGDGNNDGDGGDSDDDDGGDGDGDDGDGDGGDDGREEQTGRHPMLRDDGWMEVEMGSFYNPDDDDDDGEVVVKLMGIDGGTWKKGLIVEGIEFRPKAQSDPQEN